ncbi:MAG: penicillin-insensitive murein endopeptidase [Ahrensia sp.]|nr:penicillin-insensitive murein endopeptidase [Ahrensia sp.]
MSIKALLSLLGGFLLALYASNASAATPAKRLFGAKTLPAVMKPQVHGFYSNGCMQGAVALPTDGPYWQAMRLSRQRRWGHPDLIKTVVRLSEDARKVGWNGLLVGDISQARGGPMLTGHRSHQLGLDVDIWLNPMPKGERYTYHQRETISAQSMLAHNSKGRINQNKISRRFTQATHGLIKTAASYPKVERVLVHPTIKRELCRRATGDRRWLYKVRPFWGHHYHMHVRMGCPADSPNCRSQKPTKADDGCGAELDYWHRVMNPKPVKKKATKKKPKKVVKAKPRRQLRLADLPDACRAVLNAQAPDTIEQVTLQVPGAHSIFVPEKPIEASLDAGGGGLSTLTVPTFRPAR